MGYTAEFICINDYKEGYQYMLCRFHIITKCIIQNNIELRSLFMAKSFQKLTFAGNVYYS